MVRVPDRLREHVLRVCGDALTEAVLAAFPGGNLPGTPAEFHALEDSLLSMARAHLVAPVLVEVAHEVHRHEEFVEWCMAAAARREDLRSHGDTEVHVRLVGGAETRVLTPYMAPPTPQGKPGPRKKRGRRGKGGGGLYPVLAALGLLARTSPSVASATARAAARAGSFEEAGEALAEQGLELHADTVRTLTGHVADAGLADREFALPIDRSLAGQRVVIAPDGGRTRCRYEKGGRRRDSGYHGYETPWREPKVFAAYVINEAGRHDRSQLPVYEGTFAPWRGAVEILAKTLRRHGIEEAELVVIAADGSNNIWDQVDRLVELLGIDRSKLRFVIDFYHAVEHLHDASKLSNGFATEQQRRQWVNKQCRRLKRGQVEKILFATGALPTADAEAAEALQAECAYFRSRKEKMRYDKLRREGLPIGTGAVESAIRRIVNLRLKGPGIFWKPENAERILYLRCRLKAGRWSEVEAALHRAALRSKRSAEPTVLAQVA